MSGLWAVFGHSVGCRSPTESSGPDVTHDQCDAMPTDMLQNFFRISHRGRSGYHIQDIPEIPHSILGFHKLTVSDPEQDTPQPLSLRCYRHLILIYTGKIYNSQQIQEKFGFDYETALDGECILHLYDHLGLPDVARQLHGTYAACIINTRSKTVHVMRDVIGVRALYWMTKEDELFAISSEAKGLMDLDVGEGDMDVSVVPPGVVYSFGGQVDGTMLKNGERTIYWIGETPEYKRILCDTSTVDSSSKIRTLMSSSISLRMPSSGQVGCLLSGGLSSSVTAALMLREVRASGHSGPFPTYTIGMKGSPDLFYAREVADYIGSVHNEVIITVDDLTSVIDKVIYHLETYEVDTVREAIVMYVLCQFMKKTTEAVIVFTGDGIGTLDKPISEAMAADDALACDQLQAIYRHQALRADKMTSAFTLEARLPFFDVELISYALCVEACGKFNPDEGSGQTTRCKPKLPVRTYKMNGSGLHQVKSTDSPSTPSTCCDDDHRQTEESRTNATRSVRTYTLGDAGLQATDSQPPADSNPSGRKYTMNDSGVWVVDQEATQSATVRTYTIGECGLKQVDSAPGGPTATQAKQSVEPTSAIPKYESSLKEAKNTKLMYGRMRIREAFQSVSMVPDAVFTRDRRNLYQGIMPPDTTWEDLTKKFFESKVTNRQLRKAVSKFPYNSPLTKEAYVYREKFENMYPGQADWVPTLEKCEK